MLEITVAVTVGLVTPQMENPVALPFVRFSSKAHHALSFGNASSCILFGDVGR